MVKGTGNIFHHTTNKVLRFCVDGLSQTKKKFENFQKKMARDTPSHHFVFQKYRVRLYFEGQTIAMRNVHYV